MSNNCAVCKQALISKTVVQHTGSVGTLCEACSIEILSSDHKTELLESIDAPVLLMQREPRQVVTANNRALEVFGKELCQVEAHRGGEVFDCIHSFTAAGCGKDINCDGCTIKHAIVDTFETGTEHRAVETVLTTKRHTKTEDRTLQVSTQPLGGLVLVTVERYDI